MQLGSFPALLNCISTKQVCAKVVQALPRKSFLGTGGIKYMKKLQPTLQPSRESLPHSAGFKGMTT